jgi:quercetin dioxygenase-like cupin family protein
VSDHFVIRIPRKLAAAAVVLAATVCIAKDAGETKVVMTQSLPDIPGKQLTAVLVSYAPGGKSAPHRHAGDVFAFVVSGSIRSENSATGPAKVYQAGEGFFEPAGSKHLVSENASATEPAQLLAVFVADAHAQLTTWDK